MGSREGFRRETLGRVSALKDESERECEGRKGEEPPSSEVPRVAGNGNKGKRREQVGCRRCGSKGGKLVGHGG